MLGIEPFVFSALKPLLGGGKARYQRSLLAQKYCRGHGAEIGALMQPILVPRGSKTSYIDRVPASYWKSQPDYPGTAIIDPDILDDGATLATIDDDSFDYLIAAHVLEHIDDPVSALKNWIRVVRPGGHILIAVPDKRFCGEEQRPTTTVEHFLRDHEEGPHVSAEEHYRDFGTHMKRYSGDALEQYVREAEPMIHFHTFTLASFVQFLTAVQHLGFELVEASFNVNEDLAVLRVNAQ
ncbi:methyltransferase domain-containing protein [Sphingomonas mesophila]|uniref:methyltransferase domain-containing protein n=1 Tax=Sphingomonas mesophila TaxID=2303576 RepID=UPI0013C32568|nr:methyltransferase domain-containing protein [Sphingomonas mesophila]